MDMKHEEHYLRRISSVLVLLLVSCLTAFAQGIQIKGTIVDEQGETIIGASVVVKGNASVGSISDFDGNFTLEVPSENSVVVISYIGMKTQEIKVGNKRTFNITLEEDRSELNEVVVVGYGQQKKASIVGAITQTTGDVLERAGGVNDIGSALTGNLPGVVTVASSGMPGAEDPQITIRAASSWNSSSPLVLVDGVERSMSSVDISSVQSISVLKDASATAVYGVKGANGVILITTKRGQVGKAQIDVTVNMTMKVPSKLPSKYDSYDALRLRNVAIERELGIAPGSWADIRPMGFISMYRNQTTVEQRERYANVDWQDVIFDDYAMSYNANINVSGGTDFVRYFVSADYVNEGDLFNTWDTGRGYESGYGYNRINVRSNLDFSLTKTTTFKMNIAGSSGTRKTPWGQYSDGDWAVAQQWAGVYNIAPDVFLPRYSDGSWGYYPKAVNVTNSAQNIALSGIQNATTTTINTDFTLEQDLSFITKGLKLSGMISWDNVFQERDRGVNDLYHDAQQKYIDPMTGEVSYKFPYDTNTGFDFAQGILWGIQPGAVNNGATQRRLNYQVQLYWGRQFGKHNVSAMGLWARQETATGSEIPHYREDWVFRATYDYAGKYFFEYNGAYNGSEKFSPENRFAFFQSGALGWMISEEKWMNWSKSFLDMLKFRVSYGEIGDDNVWQRWMYVSQWAYGGNTNIDLTHTASPYAWYRENVVGNPDVKWETVKKFNFGIDYAFLGGMFAGSLDFFHDKRVDILLDGASRSVPFYFGATAPTANLGEVKTSGYELELRFNKSFNKDMRLWANFNMTHATNEVVFKDDPELYPAYQKQAGYPMGQSHAYVDLGYIQSYDELYGSVKHDTSDNQKLVGDYNIVDYNGDGVIDSDDSVPYGYSSAPENTYNATIGFEWKGFSCFVQFYGVTNVTRDVVLDDFASYLDNVYNQGSWWSKENPTADVTASRWTSTPSYNDATRYLYDGSYIRLKNAEIAYTINNDWLHKLGLRELRIYLNGNNLWSWSRMPDDRESNFAGGGGQGAYPTMRRFNLGVKFTL